MKSRCNTEIFAVRLVPTLRARFRCISINHLGTLGYSKIDQAVKHVSSSAITQPAIAFSGNHLPGDDLEIKV